MDARQQRQVVTEPVPDGVGHEFGGFYDATSTTAYSLALRITEDSVAADSACESAYVQFWRERATFSPAPFPQGQTRLLALIRLHAVKLGARGARKSGQPQSSAAAPSYTPASTVRAAFERLAEHDRRALELVYFGGMDVSEAASLLTATVSEVRGFLRNALLTLATEVHD